MGQKRPQPAQKPSSTPRPPAVPPPERKNDPRMADPKSGKATFLLVTWLGLLNAKDPVQIERVYHFVMEYFPGHVTPGKESWEKSLREKVSMKINKDLFVKLPPSKDREPQGKKGSYYTITEGSRAFIYKLLQTQGVDHHIMGLKHPEDWEEIRAGTKGLPPYVEPPKPPGDTAQINAGKRRPARKLSESQLQKKASQEASKHEKRSYTRKTFEKKEAKTPFNLVAWLGLLNAKVPVIIRHLYSFVEKYFPACLAPGSISWEKCLRGAVATNTRMFEKKTPETKPAHWTIAPGSKDFVIGILKAKMKRFGPIGMGLADPDDWEGLLAGTKGLPEERRPAERQEKPTRRRASSKALNGPPEAKKVRVGNGDHQRLQPVPPPMWIPNLSPRFPVRPMNVHQPRKAGH